LKATSSACATRRWCAALRVCIPRRGGAQAMHVGFSTHSTGARQKDGQNGISLLVCVWIQILQCTRSH
jgi:hypothetical protein